MKLYLCSILIAGIVCCLGGEVFAQAGGSQASVQMLADSSAVVAGKPFMVGFKFTISPGWHIYWKNPGDSGLPTDVKLTLPEGFKAGELQFPVPTRIALPGDVINYAYENEVMLMVQVTPPAELPAGQSVKLSAKVSWLVCKDDCMPGGSTVSLDLPVAAAASADNTDLFKQWSSQLPVTGDSQNITSTTKSMAMNNGDVTASFTVGWKKLPTDIQFIPAPLKGGDITDIKVVTTGDSTTVKFNIKAFKGHERISGLLVYTSASGVKTGVDVEVATVN